MRAIVIPSRFVEGTESAEVATSGDTYFDVIVERMSEVRKGHLEIRKMKIKDTNIAHKPGMSHYIPCLIR